MSMNLSSFFDGDGYEMALKHGVVLTKNKSGPRHVSVFPGSICISKYSFFTTVFVGCHDGRGIFSIEMDRSLQESR